MADEKYVIALKNQEVQLCISQNTFFKYEF